MSGHACQVRHLLDLLCDALDASPGPGPGPGPAITAALPPPPLAALRAVQIGPLLGGLRRWPAPYLHLI